MGMKSSLDVETVAKTIYEAMAEAEDKPYKLYEEFKERYDATPYESAAAAVLDLLRKP